jgi:three-Cys-motif partner protein
MSDSHHEWKVGRELPIIRPHSAAKHRVIRQYLTKYVEVLTANINIRDFSLTLVDGFAGGGLFYDPAAKAEHFGSPLIMLEAMKEAAAVAQLKRSNEFLLNVDYFFVEAAKDTYTCLRSNLHNSEFRSLLDTKIQVVNDTFLSQVGRIVDHIVSRAKGQRAIFVLDQLGYTDVPFSAIRTILSKVKNAEIILTFATDSLIDYLCQSDAMQRTLETLGLPLSKDEIKAAKEAEDWRRAIQFLLHERIYLNSGAKFYTPFFIRSKDAHRDYWLIHLSNHSRARDVMVSLHWLENTNFAHFGRPGLIMLGYDQEHDIKLTGQQLLLPEFRFDAQARAACLESLIVQLPERLSAHKDGVMFGDLFASLTNETPATSEIIRMVLREMLRDKMIEVRDQEGKVCRQKGVRHRTDIIVPSCQRRMFLSDSVM